MNHYGQSQDDNEDEINCDLGRFLSQESTLEKFESIMNLLGIISRSHHHGKVFTLMSSKYLSS
jgi:hypothetical protein